MNPEAEAVLDFWFGVDQDSGDADVLSKRWFASSESMDEEIGRRFGDLLGRAIAGQLGHWRDTARGTLALIILLDQFSRHVFRGTARAFAQDRTALGLAVDAVCKGWDQDLGEVECGFLYMPFQHAEDRTVQDRSVALYHELAIRARAGARETTNNFVRHAKQHRAIVARFGRFPHRNDILGREATPEEVSFLAHDQRTYGQRVGRD